MTEKLSPLLTRVIDHEACLMCWESIVERPKIVDKDGWAFCIECSNKYNIKLSNDGERFEKGIDYANFTDKLTDL